MYNVVMHYLNSCSIRYLNLAYFLSRLFTIKIDVFFRFYKF